MKKTYAAFLFLVAVVTLCSCTKTEKNYYPDGRLQSIIHYKFGKETGKSVYMFHSPNTIEIEVDMKKGKRNGDFYRYYENGNLDTYCVYVNDSIEGMEVMYSPNGEKTQETYYVHGKKNGPHKQFHYNGQIKAEGMFKDDMFDGDWTYYDERGVIVGEGHFKNGTGDLLAYDAIGRTSRITHYVHNLKDGKEIYYNPAGKVYKEITFKQDRIVSQHIDSTLIP